MRLTLALLALLSAPALAQDEEAPTPPDAGPVALPEPADEPTPVAEPGPADEPAADPQAADAPTPLPTPPNVDSLAPLSGRDVSAALHDGRVVSGRLVAWDLLHVVVHTGERVVVVPRGEIVSIRLHDAPPRNDHIERLAEGAWTIGGQPAEGWQVEERLRAHPDAVRYVERARTKTLAGLACAGSGAVLTIAGTFFAAGEARGRLTPVGGIVTSVTGLALTLGAGVPLLVSARNDRIRAVQATGGVVPKPDGTDLILTVTF